MNDILTDDNFILVAAQHYDSPFMNDDEFMEDLKRIVYVKRLFNMYLERGELKERLIVNHLIILFNMFGNYTASMLFLRLHGYEQLLKTFLTFLNRMPDKVPHLERQIYNSEISLDIDVWKRLQRG